MALSLCTNTTPHAAQCLAIAPYILQPQEGNIKLDGKDIRYLTANELRNFFGVVPQETTLFSGTIYDNLTLANPHASFEQIIQACQFAGIHETIDNQDRFSGLLRRRLIFRLSVSGRSQKLPQGYQTPIGEHGTGLSGGQKQRLAIARALLRQPQILIFDEAVSNLDQHTAEHLAQTINLLKGKVTILFITHQLPKGLHVDEAIVLGKEAQPAKGQGNQNQQPPSQTNTANTQAMGEERKEP